MKIWVDDIRPAPEHYAWAKSVDEAKMLIRCSEQTVELIDIDHDAGDYSSDGGDYIRLLDWLEMTEQSYPIRIHSMNPVGVENMRRIICRNGWTEIR